MAKWKVKPNSDASNTMHGSFEYDSGTVGGESIWSVTQETDHFLEQAKIDRETHSSKHTHVRKFATIPDIVAIDILTRFGLDIHATDFMHDTDGLRKLKDIIRKEYPYLLSS